MADKVVKKKKLNPRQELFCKLYVSKEFFANGTRAYIEAYDIDVTKKGAYKVAASGAWENLIKPDILERINELLDDAGLNDQFVDKELLFLINQKADFGAKVQAIKEYNQLKARINKSQLGDKNNPIHFVNLTSFTKEIQQKNDRELQKIAGGASNTTGKS